MLIRKIYKTLIIGVLSILVISFLPAISAVWTKADSHLAKLGLTVEALIPPSQSPESITRPPSDFGDMTVQFGESGENISTQSDGSGVEIVPGAAFIHTNELGSGTEAKDWFFSFNGGFLTNDSFAESGVNKAVCLAAPVYLPIGATIIKFQGYALDNSTASDVAIYFDRTSSFGGWTELAAVQSTGNNTSVQTLTDPSITAGANVVATENNYQVSLCLPAGSDFNILVYGAQITYLSSTVKDVYLPLVLKPSPASLLSTVYITNLSGGVVNYTIQSTPEGNITCAVPNGAKDVLCGKAFTPGTYNWKAQLICGSLGPKPKEFPPGKVYPSAFRCD
jgi:hypothetical protein